MGTAKNDEYRGLPSVDRLLAAAATKALVKIYSHKPVVNLVREHLNLVRQGLKEGSSVPSFDQLVDDIDCRARELWRSKPTRVINASGVVIHTNLGRAPLSEDAIASGIDASSGYSDLEIDLKQGGRGGRDKQLRALLGQVIGSDSALAVNNNAAALHLALSVLAKGREVIVSRGEAVEIGGGVRVPEILEQSGALLVEVGTTNKTYISDYEKAITDNTSVLLKVHTSNFKVMGFTSVPDTNEIVDLARRHKLLVFHDVGSGCLLDTDVFGLSQEPKPQDSIVAGSDLVFFSGDKLLGGPQSGIIAGNKLMISELAQHPLARTVRIDKITMAILTATLVHYLKEEAVDKIPIWRMISMSPDLIKIRAFRWQQKIGVKSKVVQGHSMIGGGSLPGATLPTWLLLVSPPDGVRVDMLARTLRQCSPAVVGRIEDNSLLLDPRTVFPEQDIALMKTVSGVLGDFYS